MAAQKISVQDRIRRRTAPEEPPPEECWDSETPPPTKKPATPSRPAYRDEIILACLRKPQVTPRVPTVTAGRYSMEPARVEQLVADYLAGDPLRVVAARYGRSMTWVRETLERLGVPRRPGGVPEPVATEEIVRLRDDECLSWAEIRQITGLTEPALLARYRNADTSGRPARRYNRLGATTDDDIRRRNEAINHLHEIRDAYWSGTSLSALAEQWGVSPRTITRWVYKT